VTFARRLLYGLTGLAAVLLMAGQLNLFAGQPPEGLGVHGGQLSRPPDTPNSVSSQADLYPGHPQQAYARIAPLPLRQGDEAASLATLATVLRNTPGVELVEQGPGYLRAQAQTRWLKFVDDLEFWFNPATGVIELRSASRLGHKDFGVNRRRIEAIRAAYLARP
jgi:uncharacterized protein (DUF1499 family)